MGRKKKVKNKELSMIKIQEIIRLGLQGQTYRTITQSCNVSIGVVSKYLNIAKDKQVTYDQIKDLSKDEMFKLFEITSAESINRLKPCPDFKTIHEELKKKNVTLFLLWEEYIEQNPDGYKYSRYCTLYNQWRGKLKISMRQAHKAGEKMFVDYAGSTVPIYDRTSGKILYESAIFVSCLGASQYTFAEATKDQKMENWINSHVRSFEYFDGVPEVVVCDNLKSGITKPNYYEPDINKTYCELAQHYGAVVIPARIRKPKDKAKVENAVQIVGRWILARLRNRKFYNLQELNKAISELLENLNNRPFKKLEGSRRSQYEDIDKPVLAPLPKDRYEFCFWKKAKVHIDYHVEVERHYYSVPYEYRQRKVDIRYTKTIVEIFYKNNRIASHLRDHSGSRFTTLDEHCPKNHQEYKGWSKERFITWAQKIGPSTAEIIHKRFNNCEHTIQAFRGCLGILGLAKKFTEVRLEAACRRALAINTSSYKSIENILKNKLDQQPLQDETKILDVPHENIRGKEYYQINTNPISAKEVLADLFPQLTSSSK